MRRKLDPRRELHICETEYRHQYGLKQVERFLHNRNWQGFDKVVEEAVEANLSCGAGHNKAIASIGSAYHLVLNPDVAMAEDSLGIGLDYPTCKLTAVP